jgi:hypothetical protein
LNIGRSPEPPHAPPHAAARLVTLEPAGRPPIATTPADSAVPMRQRPTFETAVD